MSELGSFGSVVFSVSDGQVMTFRNLQRRGDARFARHDVLNVKPRLEFLGPGLEKIEFEIMLDIGLGVDPETELKGLRGIRDAGEEKVLVIAGGNIGSFCLVSLHETWTRTAGDGRLLAAMVKLSLEEFIDGD